MELNIYLAKPQHKLIPIALWQVPSVDFDGVDGP